MVLGLLLGRVQTSTIIKNPNGALSCLEPDL